MPLSWALWRWVTGSITSRPLGLLRGAVGLAALAKGVDFAVTYGLSPPVVGLWVLAAAALMIGYHSRVAAVMVAGLTVCVIAFADIYSNHLYFLGTLALLLSLTDCGASVSLDSRRGGSRDQVRRGPVTLIQLQISVVYFFSAISKVNVDFLPGNSLYYHSREALLLPDVEAVAHTPLFMVVAVAVVVLELFIAFGLWFDRVRLAVFGVGFALHLGMIVTLSDSVRVFGRLAVFALLALSCYLLFLKVPLHGRVMVWDDSCSFCSKWVRWFKRLDWLGAFRFVGLSDVEAYRHLGVTPESAGEALRLVDLDGRIYDGFEALRRVLQVLPVSFLWAPYLALPPVRALGDLAYGAVASRRTRQVAYAR